MKMLRQLMRRTALYVAGMRAAGWRHAGLLAAAVLVSGAAQAATMEYLYWDWGKTTGRDDYQIAALRLALEKTVPTHGPYAIKRIVESYSTRRVRREVFAGKHLNVHVGPWRSQDPDNPFDRNIKIEYSVMGGMLGYRKLLVRRDDLDKFARIRSDADLKRMVAGQGRDWAEVAIYRHNGYQVDDRANLSTLLPMLVSKRFDYLPMSVIEVDSVLELYPRLASKLAVVPGMLIQYDFPTVFYVSASRPDLAARLEQGMAKASKDGSLHALLDRHFRRQMHALRTGTKREFILVNPFLPERMRTPPVTFQK